MRKYSWIAMLFGLNIFAQTPTDDFFYSNNKIYVVVLVLVIIFIGIASYLFRLDRKITKLEKNNEA
ncbi:MAG: CcmD family protein [Bacteroidetes bacterium]|nr:MAG: CcmD family protein [Bacteroidota bacterium]